MTTKREDELDRASRPLRDAINRWAVERGLGFAGGWKQAERRWEYSLYNTAIKVFVMEDGSRAFVQDGKHTVEVNTALSLRRELTKLYRSAAEK